MSWEIELTQKDQGVLLVHVHTAVKDLMKKTLIAKPAKKKGKVGFNAGE